MVSTAGGFISSVTNSHSTTAGENNEDGQPVNPTASVPDADAESSITSSTTPTTIVSSAADTSTSNEEIPPPEVVSSEGGEIIQDLEIDGVSSGRKDIEPNLQNKSAELEDDPHVAAAEGEDKGAEVDATSSSSFSHSASGEGSAGGVLDPIESGDPNNPSMLTSTLSHIYINK